MASGPYFDKRRGTYSVQWFDGRKWTRAVVHKIPGWKVGRPEPKKVPPEAMGAVKEYAEREKAARQRRALDPGLSVAAFLESYRAAYAQDRAAGSLDQLRQNVRNFLDWCGPAKVERVEQVTPGVCQRYIDHRAAARSRKTGQPITPARLSHERAILSGAWRRAVRLRELPENPWTLVEIPGWEKRRKARAVKPSWTPEEFARLHGAAAPWLRDILTVGTQTGLRVSALIGLEWRDVKWAKPDAAGFGEVEVRPELDKTGKGYRVPMSRACHDTLARRWVHRGQDHPYVLTGARGGPGNLNVTATAIIRCCARAGLPRPKSPNHHMRRTFGRWAVMGHLTGRPIPLYVVSRWMGHSAVKMTETYLDIHVDESANWMEEVTPPAPPGTPPPASDPTPRTD